MRPETVIILSWWKVLKNEVAVSVKYCISVFFLEQLRRNTKYIREFDIHMYVHRKCNSKLQPTRCNFFIYLFIYLFLQTLYMFQAVLPPIIRRFRYCQPILLLAAIVDEMELISSHPRSQQAAVLVDNN